MSRNRRSVLRAGAVAATAALAGCGSGGSDDDGGGGDGTADAAATPSVESYLQDARGFEGVVDRTGRSELRVAVGAGPSGLAFDPAGARVSAGTTVVWEWTGEGGNHNVVAEDGSFSSSLAADAGHTYSRDFPDPGPVRYYCRPHLGVGMKGALRVVEG